jgi:hypothetical protein
MKTLALILALTIAVHGQELLSADGVKWQYIGVAQDTDGRKFNVYARRTESGPYRELEVRFDGDVVRYEYDCKTKAQRPKGDTEWERIARGTVGMKLVKFACKK